MIPPIKKLRKQKSIKWKISILIFDAKFVSVLLWKWEILLYQLPQKSISTTTTTTSKSSLLLVFRRIWKTVSKLHLPENWQIDSSSNYYRILILDRVHDIPIFDIYTRNNLKFTICMFAVCIPANHEIYMKFSKSVKNITLSNLVQEISHYCICEVLKIKKNSKYQKHPIPKIFNPNVTTPSTFAKILQINFMFLYLQNLYLHQLPKIWKSKNIYSKIH